MAGDSSKSEGDEVMLGPDQSYSGIPLAHFVDDVDAYMALPDNDNNADKVLRRLDEQHNKYKFMEMNLLQKKRKLKNQVPDLRKSLEIVSHLEEQKMKGQEAETEFLMSDQVYMKAVVPPTDKVCLWLGANVMLEYTLKEAAALLQENATGAEKLIAKVQHDLDFLRDQFTTTEVNMARVFNWDVKRRQSANTATPSAVTST